MPPTTSFLQNLCPQEARERGDLDRCHWLWFGWPFLGQRDADGHQRGEVSVQFFPAEGSGSAGGEWGSASGSAAANFAADEVVIEFWESYDDAGATVDAEYTGGTITISYGTASDCNGNGVDDASELGPDTDCDSSGVLDECESLTTVTQRCSRVCEGRCAQRSVRKRHPHGLERTSDWQHRVCW